MKIKISAVTVIIWLFANAFSCSQNVSNQYDKKNDLVRYNIKGAVKSIKEVQYEESTEFGEKRKMKSEGVNSYNEQGYLIEEYISNTNYAYKFTSKYDQKGNRIEWNGYNLDGDLKFKTIYTYDSENRLLEEKSGGNILSISMGKDLDSVNPNLFNDISQYEIQGNKIEVTRSKNGSLYEKVICEFDAQGNKIEERKYEPDGKLFRKYIYRYDRKGNRIERYIYDSFGDLDIKDTYKYDSQDKEVEINVYDADILASVNRYTYDAKGNRIEWIREGPNHSLEEKTTYKYDLHDNWVTKTTTTTKNKYEESICVFEREINYYK